MRSFIDVDESEGLVTTSWSFEFVKSRRSLKAFVVPANKVGRKIFGAIHCLVVFEEALFPTSVDGDRIRIRSHYARPEAMIKLEKAGSDYVALTNGSDRPIEELQLIMCVPNTAGHLAVAFDPSASTVKRGEPMAGLADLDDYSYLTGADYVVAGYRAEGVLPGEKVGARFTRIA